MGAALESNKVDLLDIVDGLMDKLSRISCLRRWASLSLDERNQDGAGMAVHMMRDYVEQAQTLINQLDQLRRES
jgi:hypothetical protein